MGWAVAPERVTHTPLLHLFLGHTSLGEMDALARDVRCEPWALFFGRLERYKGLGHLVQAWEMLDGAAQGAYRLVLAGPGSLERVWASELPPQVDVHNATTRRWICSATAGFWCCPI